MAKYSVNLPDEIYDSLCQWAEAEGRNKGSLSAFLLESAVRLRYPEKHPPRFFVYPPASIDPAPPEPQTK